MYTQGFEYTYGLEKDALVVQTGHGQYKFTIENAELLEHAPRIASLIIDELKALESREGTVREVNHYARLLLASLNICEKYIKLERKYAKTLESVQQLKADLEQLNGPSSPVGSEDVVRTRYTAAASRPSVPGLHPEKESGKRFGSAGGGASSGPEVVSAPPRSHSLPFFSSRSSISPDSTVSVRTGTTSSQQAADGQRSTGPGQVVPGTTAPKPAVGPVGKAPPLSRKEEMARSLEAFEKTRATDTTNAACLPEAESRPAAHAEPCTGPSETAVPTSSVHQQEGINQQSASLEPGQSERYPQSAIDSGDSLASALPETALGFPPAGADGTVPFSSTSWGRQRGDDAFTAPVPQYPEGDSCSDQEADTVVPAAPASPAGDQDETERRAIPIVSPAMGAAVEPESTTTDAVQQRAIPPVSDKQAVSESSAQSVPPESPTPPELDTERRPARPADEEQLEVGSREADSSSLLVADVAGYSAPWESSPAELAPGNAYADTETAEDFSDATDAYQLPLLTFLRNTSDENLVDQNRIRSDAELLEKKLGYFGIKGEVMGISPGPVITTYEYKPDPGIKISKIVNLADDLALALSAFSIRIVAPIPGKDVMGIEIPNIQKSLVPFIDIVTSEVFSQSTSRLPICLGKDIVGAPVVVELESMPHLLIAGATGTGKSVGLNAMITSILYRATPDEVRFLMVDPKRIELSFYNDIPHLLTPVITDMNKANLALQWLVREMDRRYNLLAHFQVRHIEQFNQKLAGSPTAQYDEHGEKLEPLPYIVVIIDELADLMMTASRDIEFSLTRLAQMARAAGIHLILATQRPSVDVLTGIIKANFPTRISFQVSSKTDSRTIIDSNGAETLLGNGDMLFVPPGSARLTRVHGTYLSEEELVDITTFIKRQRKPNYIFDVITEQEPDELVSNGVHDEYDEKYNEALDYVMTTRQASISGVQRALRVGYNRAARIIDLMEKNGVVGPSDGVKPRKVLASSLHMGG